MGLFGRGWGGGVTEGSWGWGLVTHGQIQGTIVIFPGNFSFSITISSCFISSV